MNKNLFLLSLITIFIITLISKGGHDIRNVNVANAAEESPVTSTSEYQCLGDALAEYLMQLVLAKQNGEIGEINLLTPAFNLTSGTLPGISQAFMNSLASNHSISLNDLIGSGDIAGIAGNLYNAGGQPMNTHMDSNVIPNFGSLPLYITESGNHSSFIDANLLNTFRDLFNSNSNVQGALLFNALLTNPDPNFNYHGLSESTLINLCSQLGNRCGLLGINLGTAFQFGANGAISVNGEHNAYRVANNLGMGYTLQIIENNQNSIDQAKTAIASYLSANSNAKVIIRIGTGDGSGGFDDPADYVSALSQIANAIGGNSDRILAIGGPNEPDIETWVAPGCYLACANGQLTIDTNFCSLSGPVCQGPLRLEPTRYTNTWTKVPFLISARLFTKLEKADSDSIPDIINSNLRISKPSTYIHTDFSPIINQRIGSLSPTDTINYIGTDKGKFNAAFLSADLENESDVTPASLPLHLVFDRPNQTIRASWGITQNHLAQRPGENPDQFTRRYFGATLDTDNVVKPGLKSKIPNPLVVGCLQKINCDPKMNIPTCQPGQPCRPSNCLKMNSTTEFCDLSESPENCTSIGRPFFFSDTAGLSDGINMSEQTEVQAKKRIFSNLTQEIVMPPNAFADNPGLAINRPDFAYNPLTDNAELAESQSNFDELQKFLQETDELQNDPSRKVKLAEARVPASTTYGLNGNQTYISDQSKQIQSDTKIVGRAYAEAQADQVPWGDDSAFGDQCDGLRVIVENKGDHYAVKAWNIMPDACGALSDYGLLVNYYHNGQKVGSCQFSMIGGDDYIDRYEPNLNCAPDDKGCNKKKYGTSISDFGGGLCAVPIHPNVGGSLVAEVIVTNSHGVNDPAIGCRKDPFCTCNDQSCTMAACADASGNAIPCPPPVINCNVCNSWSPPEYCNDLVDVELNPTQNCVNGKCEASVRTRFDNSSRYEDGTEGEFNLGSILQGIIDWWGDASINLADIIYSFTCNISEDADGLFSTNGCGFNRATFSVHAYIPNIIANMEQNTTAVDMQLYNAVGHIPGTTDRFFTQYHAMQYEPLILSKSANPTLDPGESVDICQSDSDTNCADIDLTIIKNTTDYQLQFYTHFQQVRQHCSIQAQFSYPSNFPSSQASFCKEVLAELRPKEVVANLLKENTRFTQYAKNFDDLAKIETEQKEPLANQGNNETSNNVVETTEITQTQSVNQTNALAKQKIDKQVTQGINNYINTQTKYFDAQQEFLSELEQRLTVIVIKYVNKYGLARIKDSKTFGELPIDMQNEILQLKDQLASKKITLTAQATL